MFVLQICELSDKHGDKFEGVIEQAGLPRLLPSEMAYLREYVWVTHPVAYALNLLQREKYMFLGYLLPTVYSLIRQLESRRKMNGKPLKHCLPLLNEMIRSISSERRFGCMMTDRDLIVATSLIPCFKLDWDGLNQYSNKEEIKEILLKQMGEIDDGTHPCARNSIASCNTKNDGHHDSFDGEQHSESPDEDSMFFGLDLSALSRHSSISDDESIEEELARFLSSTGNESIEECYGEQCKKPFRRLKQLFLFHNTALPSSASVERLFSLVGGVFQADRANLSDGNLEMQSLMCANCNIV